MSKTKIPPKVQLEVWLKAAGRCQYPGCNIPLWKDSLTLSKMNRAYLAHIVADQPDGPRGDAIESPRLKADPSNIMLLCDTHHRLIDREEVAAHPVALLDKYKKEHELRIERQTAIQPSKRTHLLLLGTKIGDRRGQVNFEDAHEAILPERYPATDQGIRIDLSNLNINEADSEFWPTAQKLINRTLDRVFEDGVSVTGEPINHLSVFAIAPIPLLIFFGRKLGDIITTDLFQHHRNVLKWKWSELEDDDFDYIISKPSPLSVCERVAVNLSLSGKIHPKEIEMALSEKVPTYSITIYQPNVSFLKAKEQLELFRSHWRILLSEIRESHGEDCEIHVFPAIPAPVAIELGRALLPHADPTIHIYNKFEGSAFKLVLTL